MCLYLCLCECLNWYLHMFKGPSSRRSRHGELSAQQPHALIILLSLCGQARNRKKMLLALSFCFNFFFWEFYTWVLCLYHFHFTSSLSNSPCALQVHLNFMTSSCVSIWRCSYVYTLTDAQTALDRHQGLVPGEDWFFLLLVAVNYLSLLYFWHRSQKWWSHGCSLADSQVSWPNTRVWVCVWGIF